MRITLGFIPAIVTLNPDLTYTISTSDSSLSSAHSITLTEDQWNRYVASRRPGGSLMQDALPDLSPDSREFLISGMSPSSFDSAFSEDDDSDDDFSDDDDLDDLDDLPSEEFHQRFVDSDIGDRDQT